MLLVFLFFHTNANQNHKKKKKQNKKVYDSEGLLHKLYEKQRNIKQWGKIRV